MKKVLCLCFLATSSLPAMLVRYLADGTKKHEVEMVDTLLKMGESVDQVDDELQRSVLGWAVATGDKDIVERILQKKPDVNTADKCGRTPLMLAAFGDFENGSYELIFRLLLENGAVIRCVDRSNRTVLDYALMTPKKNGFVLNQLFAAFAAEHRYAEQLQWWQKQLHVVK